MAQSRNAPRRVVILAYPGLQSLDLAGPLEVFHGAGELIRSQGDDAPGYHVEIVAKEAAPLSTTSGLSIVPAATLAQTRGRIDTLIVPGGTGKGRAAGDPELLAWIRDASRRARRTAGVCTGAFLLAEAGLLEGRRATTHWAWSEALAGRYPGVRVDPDPIFVRDGDVWTSAGVTAGMDLALALVEDDHDRELALTIARHLVLFLRRPGNQSQFSATLVSQEPRREPLREMQRHVVEDPAGDHSVEAMAERVHMSPRHFARAFRAETGITPARYVERVRLEAARRHLEESSEPIGTIARACGFGTPESMRRSFLRALEVGPAEYRRRFQAAPSQPPVAA